MLLILNAKIKLFLIDVHQTARSKIFWLSVYSKRFVGYDEKHVFSHYDGFLTRRAITSVWKL